MVVDSEHASGLRLHGCCLWLCSSNYFLTSIPWLDYCSLQLLHNFFIPLLKILLLLQQLSIYKSFLFSLTHQFYSVDIGQNGQSLWMLLSSTWKEPSLHEMKNLYLLRMSCLLKCPSCNDCKMLFATLSEKSNCVTFCYSFGWVCFCNWLAKCLL